MKKRNGRLIYDSLLTHLLLVSTWTTDDVVKWLEAIQLEDSITQFKLNHIDGSALLSLTPDDLKVKCLHDSNFLYSISNLTLII